MVKTNMAMALAFGALNVADYMTTRRILNTGGEEVNPIAAFFIRKNCFGAFKAAVTLTGMLTIYEGDDPKIAGKVLLGFYGFVVAHNVREILRHEIEELKTDARIYDEKA